MLADYYPLIYGILLALFLICVIAYIIKRIRNKQSLIPFKKPEPKLPPHEQAIKELALAGITKSEIMEAVDEVFKDL